MIKDLIRALSLANLCFMAVWSDLIATSINPRAQWARYDFSSYVAVLINVPALAAAFWIAMILVRRSRSALALDVARLAFLFVLPVAVNGILLTQFPDLPTQAAAFLLRSGKTMALAAVIAGVGTGLLLRFRQAVIKAGLIFILLLSPFCLLTFGQAIWLMTKFKEPPAPPVIATASAKPQRVLWLVFDELDYRLAFVDRPASLKLPELDSLRRTALFATNAHPPANQTLLSIPALITGKLVSEAIPSSPSELSITYDESNETVGWSTQPNLFSRAYAAGYNTAAIGWYHPYCRIIGGSLTYCAFIDRKSKPVTQKIPDQLRSVVGTIPLAANVGLTKLPFLRKPDNQGEESVSEAIAAYADTLKEAKKVATDRTIGLALVHWTIPHLPNIYDRDAGEFGGEKNNYFDNLALVDRALAELRAAMEAAGVWEQTNLLITSDHPVRKRRQEDKFPHLTADEAAVEPARLDPRVPFLLKLAGQQEGISYEAPFNTVLTHDLFLAILHGEIADPVGLTGWLDKNRSVAEARKASKQKKDN
ncbi:MAG TPA: sulfatase-like hydrolase/transferase [Blastocatellia bacterium]|nr:sulfatase-like hydrolase/transferase [Blastocatellia bacterium]